jgi:hypothetical protein
LDRNSGQAATQWSSLPLTSGLFGFALRRANSSVCFSISSGVIFGGSTLDRSQKYLLGVFLDELPSCQRARETLVRKRYQSFWKAFPTVKVADTLLINRAFFHRNGNPRFVHSSAFVAGYQDAVLSRRVGYSGR